jgi:hypothetical protein
MVFLELGNNGRDSQMASPVGLEFEPQAPNGIPFDCG